ncbi:MAG: hypothetical protein JNJ95_06090 [Dechloromonas sp.]|nr:hypothetical protein [Dechloromonas sp.]
MTGVVFVIAGLPKVVIARYFIEFQPHLPFYPVGAGATNFLAVRVLGKVEAGFGFRQWGLHRNW